MAQVQNNKAAPLAALGLLIFGVLALGLFLTTIFSAPDPSVLIPEPKELSFKATSFLELSGWTDDRLAESVPALVRSCALVQARDKSAAFGSGSKKIGREQRPLAGTNDDWRDVCHAVSTLIPGNNASARGFFEAWFTPVQIIENGQTLGLFTGYYEPVLRGSRQRSDVFSYPLLARPSDLIQVDLGAFREDLRGKRIAGRISGNSLTPYETRPEIEAGKLGDKTQALVYLDDWIEAFFLHIQGSGRIEFEDGSVMRAGYAGQNGHEYLAVGRLLIQRGIIAREDMSMQAIEAWARTHEAEAKALFAENLSYVFFREIKVEDPALGPLGGSGLALTPARSLAIDRSFYAYGLPVWLDTTIPAPHEGADLPFQRLMVTQDTGGAIRGAIRGDVFWGFGAPAADIAGRMKQDGSLTLLLPNAVAERLLSTQEPR